jgi:Tfp pilus assembly protein PilF
MILGGLMLAGLAALAPALSPAEAARARDSAPAGAPARGLPDSQLAPQSLMLLQQGEAVLAQGQSQAATDLFEAALAVDPRNRRAWLGLARAAEAEGLPGKAVRFYREALAIEPGDITVLELQGLAMVERGARARAEDNLERVRRLCGTAACPSGDRLAAAIARGATPRTAELKPPAN